MSATQQRNTLTPEISWDRRLGRYRDVSSGRLVASSTVRRELDRVLDRAERDARAVTQRLRDRTISVADWQREMATNIRRSQSAASALAHGGWAEMTPSRWGQVGGNVARELRYLDRFARQIASGEIPLDGRVLSRAESYILSSRIQYERQYHDLMVLLGYTTEQNILHARDSCTSCLSNTAQGVVVIGDLPPIGSGVCRSRCRCTRTYA